jgi:iron complex outermembrane recepter protein
VPKFTLTTRGAIAALTLALAHNSPASAGDAASPGDANAATTASPAASGDVPTTTTRASELTEIIVTGTRLSGVTAAESATPIELVNSAEMSHVATPSLNNILATLVPSFTEQAFGNDTAGTTLSAKLRGLSPNHTLILVNGKRRHGTADLQVYEGPFQGGIAPDLDFITPASIDHIEVLEDGAAAQYGSDAIAGVINIILKKDSGGSFSTTGGQYYAGDGTTTATSANYGFDWQDGYLNLTGFYRYHGHSARGGGDVRVANPDGTIVGGLSPKLAAAYEALPGFPDVNPYNGDAESQLGVMSYNAGINLGDAVKAYSFGTVGVRDANLRENVRLPDKIVASPTLGVAANYNDPDAIIFAPEGFIPMLGNRELDYSATFGLERDIFDWHFDLSTTYGRDHVRIVQHDSANESLFINTHYTPTTFFDGAFDATEWTNDLDVTRNFGDVATLALGSEYRRNTYGITQGDPASRYEEGSQAYPGFQSTDAGEHTRHNYAFYSDLALTPLTQLKLDGAVRYENYSDFGGNVSWKANGRYDVSPAIALRGTVATGFRAPSLAEEYYSATTTSPFFANAQIPADSSAAKLLGVGNLKPEKSRSYSAGLVLNPLPRLTLTFDAYQIDIDNRIINSGVIQGTSNFAIISPAVLQAIAAHGNVLDSTVSATGVQIFSNALNTRTRGVDAVVSYVTDFDKFGKVNWTVLGNYNDTGVSKINQVPGPIAASGQAIVNPVALSFLETASPKYKVILGGDWTLDKFTLTLRETFYGATHVFNTADGTEYTNNPIKATGITDLELDYRIRSNTTLAFGAQNLFNRPSGVDQLNSKGELSDGFAVYNAPLPFSPYGIDGGYWYGRLTVAF